MEMHEEHLPQRGDGNKMLKEKLLSRLRFGPERTEVLLMAQGRNIVYEPADSSEKDISELLSPVRKTHSALHTAVHRASSERKPKARTQEEDMCFGNVLSGTQEEGREEFVCQPTSISEQETMKLTRSLQKPPALMSENEHFQETLATASACRGAQHAVDTPPSPSASDNARKTEKQTAFQPSCHRRVCDQPGLERSSKKPLRSKVNFYDQTEPSDDDVLKHILRLRGKLGWQTKLPPPSGEGDVSRLQQFMKPLLSEDSGEYIYSLERNRNNPQAPYNPYDLQAVSTNTALLNKEYWTVTASFVTKFSAGEVEITAVPQWLYERQLYYKLLNLNFFSNFRVMKYFLVWKHKVRRCRRNKPKSI